MSPKPADILNTFALVVEERVVDGNDSLSAVARRGILLEEVETALVELLGIPYSVGEEAVEAGLVRGLGKLTVDPGDVFSVGHEQAGEILGEMPSLRFVGQQGTG